VTESRWPIRLGLGRGPAFTVERATWLTLGIALAVGGWWWWRDGQRSVSTDNAFVDADVILLSSRVSGFVVRVMVTPNDEIRLDQPLVLIDPADFQLRLTAALAKQRATRAALVQLAHQADERQAARREKIATLAGAQAANKAMQAERERIVHLAAAGWVTARLLQSTIADAEQGVAKIEEARAGIAAEAARRRAVSTEAEMLAADIAAANAEVSHAQLDLERTSLRAPVHGTVGPVLARVGEFVKPGDVVMQIVPSRAQYIIANFKETQVGRLRVGQIARITLDAYPNEVLTGKVQSLSPATGSKFAAMPIDNANGNFVKIVQRMPVRIRLVSSTAAVADRMLRPGLSATVSVIVGNDH